MRRQHPLLSWEEQEDGAAASPTSCLPCPLLWHQKELSVWLWGEHSRDVPQPRPGNFDTNDGLLLEILGVFLPKPNLDGDVSTTAYQNKTERTLKLGLWAKIVVKDQRNERKFRSLKGEAVISEQELSNSDTFGKQWKRCTYKTRHHNTNPM